MNSDTAQIQLLLDKLQSATTRIEEACLYYGEAKAELQLEIYRLLREEDIEHEEIAKMISDAIDKVDSTIEAHHKKTKFFREK